MALTVKTNKNENRMHTVILAGAIDGESYMQLEDTLKELIASDPKAILLDMGAVDYLSSIGVRVLISAKNNSDKANITFGMGNLQPQIKRILDVMKLLPIFELFDEMPDADKYIDQIIDEELKKQ